MSEPVIFNKPIPRETIQKLADDEFVNMIKFVVDVDRRMICAGGGLHSDEEQLLIDDGSCQTFLWGANFYLDRPAEKRLVYTSMINIRPSDGNTRQEIISPAIQQKVKELADYFFEEYS